MTSTARKLDCHLIERPDYDTLVCFVIISDLYIVTSKNLRITHMQFVLRSVYICTYKDVLFLRVL